MTNSRKAKNQKVYREGYELHVQSVGRVETVILRNIYLI